VVGATPPSAPPPLAATGSGPDLRVGPRPERPLPQFQGASALPVGVPEADATALDGVAVLLLGVGAAPAGGPAAADAPAVVLGPGSAGVESATGLDLAAACAAAEWRAPAGSVLPVPGAVLPGGARLVLLGAGKGTARDLRRAGAALARASRGSELVATTAVAGLEPALVGAFAEGVLLGAWAPPRTGTSEGPPAAVAHVRLLGWTGRPTVPLPGDAPGPAWSTADVASALTAATTAATATWRVRDLAATPSSTKTPAWVAEQAVALCAGTPGLSVTVLDEEDLAERRAGGLLAVGAASQHPPCLVRVDWTPRTPSTTRRAVLVGKGITYDTGGLALKPRESMVAMKTDMAGAAVVLAAVVAAAEADLPRPVTALLPLAENSLGAASYRPGDVVRVLGGTTVEVDNPDAEGRLVLADALALADAELDPDLVVDVATLTGAATLGLGRQHAALYTADDDLAGRLSAAGEETGERVWRMPLVEEYRAGLDSDVADLRHVPSSPSPGAGSVTAALFLREFTGGRRWAHLDIAGVGRADAASHEVPKGATGWGARLLLRLLRDLP